jgi:protein-tyrosine phosphatase
MTTLVKKQKIVLPGFYNLRDLGGYPVRSGGSTSGRILRGDCLTAVSEQDQKFLADYGLRTVIDLRNAAERERIPRNFQHCADIVYHEVPLIPENNFASFAGPPESFTLGGMYIAILDNAQAAILQVFRIISRAGKDNSGRILIHCTAGKDRTGIFAALLLEIAGVDRETIIRDYALTDENFFPVQHILRQNSGVPAGEEALADELLYARPQSMEIMLAHVQKAYGGAEKYLTRIGLIPAELETIIDIMHEGENRHE